MSYPPSHPAVSTTSSLAIVSLVFGILCWVLLPFLGAIVAIICGHLARGEIRRSPVDHRLEGDGMAVAGLVLGYVQLALGVLLMMFVILVIFGFAFAGWR